VITAAGNQLRNSYAKQRQLLAQQHEAELQMGALIHEAERRFTVDYGRVPVTDEDKKQAILNEILRRKQ